MNPRFSILFVMILAILVTVGAVAQETEESTQAPEATPAAEAEPESTPATETETSEPESTDPPGLSYETTVGFELLKRFDLEGSAGEVEFRGVEFTVSSAKGGVLGTSDADIKATIGVMLDCSTEAKKKAKFDLTVQFFDGEGALVDRLNDSDNVKNESKIVKFKHTTLKYAVPLIKTAKITAVYKGK